MLKTYPYQNNIGSRLRYNIDCKKKHLRLAIQIFKTFAKDKTIKAEISLIGLERFEIFIKLKNSIEVLMIA